MKTRTRVVGLLSAAIALSTARVPAAAAPTAPAETPSASAMAEAKMRYERGLKLYDEGNYDAARVEMQRAYELAPTYRILYNLGLVHRQLNDYAAALRAFTQYLTEGGKKVEAKRRAEVEKYLVDLKAHVATLTIEVDKPGAEVSIDDATIGTSPLAEPVLVNAGKRRITARVPGRAPETKVVTVAGGDAVTVKLELGEPTADKPPPPPTPAPAKPKASNTPLYVAWGTTAGLALGAGVSATFLFLASRDLRALKGEPAPVRADLESAASKTKTWALVTDIFLAGTLVAGGVATYLTLRSEGRTEPSPRPSPPPHAALRLGIGFGFVTLSGGF